MHEARAEDLEPSESAEYGESPSLLKQTAGHEYLP